MFGLFGGKKKKEFMSDNSKAYFHIYCAKNITIDNQKFSELEHIKGDDLEDVIKVLLHIQLLLTTIYLLTAYSIKE